EKRDEIVREMSIHRTLRADLFKEEICRLCSDYLSALSFFAKGVGTNSRWELFAGFRIGSVRKQHDPASGASRVAIVGANLDRNTNHSQSVLHPGCLALRHLGP